MLNISIDKTSPGTIFKKYYSSMILQTIWRRFVGWVLSNISYFKYSMNDVFLEDISEMDTPYLAAISLNDLVIYTFICICKISWKSLSGTMLLL